MSADLLRRCEAIEEAYEFTLSYAAQGLTQDTGTPLRDHLERARDALEGLEGCCNEAAAGLEPAAPFNDFAAIVGADAERARAALSLVLAQPTIGSGLIDSLNASLHIRALLADLFLLSEILTARTQTASPRASD